MLLSPLGRPWPVAGIRQTGRSKPSAPRSDVQQKRRDFRASVRPPTASAKDPNNVSDARGLAVVTYPPNNTRGNKIQKLFHFLTVGTPF
jgi:hypothetical protein